ncbi:MAG TPA: hypothetical protein PKC30_08890 [Saprospiraceae bacterium]|nr:hypothetical protein [Saprospiraceae bacterium]
MKNVVLLICAVFISYAAMGSNAIPHKDIHPKENPEFNEIVSEVIIKFNDLSLISSNKEEDFYSCDPCFIIEVTCCGQTIQAQYCENCHHGPEGAYNLWLCAQLCSQQ